MKILIIHGSPRKGNTWNILNLVKEKINNQIDAEYEVLELSKINLKMCAGCFNCILKGEDKCPHYKEMNYITNKIEKCDGFIITSPVYSLQISALLKNFIDHMSYNFHRPRYFTKKALIITTTAGIKEKDIANYIEEVLNFWGINSTYKIAIKYRENYINENTIEKEVNKFANDLKSDTYKAPNFKTIAYYNGFRCMSMILYGEYNADYKYWRNTGLCNYSYSPDIKVGKIKSIFGEFVYKAMSKGMSKNK